MTPIEKKGARFGLALLAAAALSVSTVAAAAHQAAGAAETPDDALSRNLKLIADSPHNVGALVGAGKAALELGDAQAALTFFARAEQDAPRDGWVKKWMGSALVQLEQPAAALKFFRDAVQLGVPDASVAGDRGLAWDISGDPRRAQRDYRLSLSHEGDPEVTRRLALSLAIGGERGPALQLIEDQVMRRDPAALRTRALVLALTGDRAGADRAVESAMPGPQAEALEPFLARLPALSLADRALAVHLGHFPGNGRSSTPPPTAYAQNNYGPASLPAGYTPQSYSAPSASRQNRSLTDAGRPDENRPGFGRSVGSAEPDSAEPRRIPGAQSEAARPAPVRGQSQTRSQWSWSRGELSEPRRTETASARPAPAIGAPRPEPAPPQAAEPDADDETDDNAAPQQADSRPAEVAEAETAPPIPTPPPPAAVPAPSPAPVRHGRTASHALSPPTQPGSRSRLADVAGELDRIEQERARERAAGVPPAGTRMSDSRSRTRTRLADATPEPAAKAKPKAKKPPPPPRDPARHWVQVAGGADRDTLPREFARLKEKAPKLFAGRVAWAATANATNRLLVGPFDSDDDAQDFVNRLHKEDLHGFPWTSETGQKVEKLPAK